MAEVDLDSEETTPSQTLLLEALEREFAPHGFTLDFAHWRFTRRRGAVVDRFLITFFSYATGGYRAIPHAGLRIDRVEDIFHQTSGMERKYQKDTATIGAPIGHLLGGKPRQYEYDMKTDDQIAGAVAKIVRDFRKVALPHYEKFGSLAAIDAALNNKPGERVVHFALAWFRCSKGLIVAKLVGRKNYDQLAKFYLEVMEKDNKGFYMKRFGPLVKSLEAIGPEAIQ